MKKIRAFFRAFLLKLKRIRGRVPRGIRIILGPLVGGLVGLVGGAAGVVIGAALGSLIQELFGQFGNDREIRRYYENPGAIKFPEGRPGLAAFCGLGILVAEKSGHEDGEVVVRETALTARATFPLSEANSSTVSPSAPSGVDEPAMAEQFCGIAWSVRKNLNPDLLLESLAARLKDEAASAEQLTRLGKALYGLAATPRAQAFAGELRSVLDPRYKPPVKTDPWKILGISPETPVPDVKAHYRRLAAQFHPDTLQGLDDEHQKTAAGAFIAIQEAYREILRKANSHAAG